MNTTEIYDRLNDVFRDVFDDENITVHDETVAKDIEGWDSLMHITLMQAVEDEFDVKFSMKEIVGLHKVGDLVSTIEKKA